MTDATLKCAAEVLGKDVYTVETRSLSTPELSVSIVKSKCVSLHLDESKDGGDGEITALIRHYKYGTNDEEVLPIDQLHLSFAEAKKAASKFLHACIKQVESLQGVWEKK